MRLGELRHHRMRAYYLPFVAGAVLAASAFLPRLVLSGVGLGSVPAPSALWVLGLGVAAMVLASLSIATRRNSRHPLLLVGLVALAIEFLGWQWTRRSAESQAWASAQAAAIVAGGPAADAGRPAIGAGLYLGVIASILIVLFGLTIVVKQASTLYAQPEDDI
jgi:hypothetical protein